MDKQAHSAHIIDGNGILDGIGLDNFINHVKMGDLGPSYVVVAIMGPQSSGKSTLLNHLFHTNFTEMNASKGRPQTTLGIWMAKCAGIQPCTIVMDLEGSGGRERGENMAFERQIALFALAVSDVVLINIWHHEIGHVHGPLLEIVFQAMLQLFGARKTTLMFVIRDKSSKSSLDSLTTMLEEDIQKIWDSIPKPKDKQTTFNDFFNVQYVGLPSYEEKEDQFKEEVAKLRERFSKSTEAGGLAGVRQEVIPASGFSISAQQIWKVIKENKNLDLPSHKVMVANMRCEQIANEELSSFTENEEWLKLEELVKSNLVPGFGKKVSSLLNNLLSSYDKEASYFEESIKTAQRTWLEENLIQLVQPTYQLMLEHLISGTSKSFKIAFTGALDEDKGFALAADDCKKEFMTLFDEQCQDAVIEQGIWDSSKEHDKFSKGLDSHITKVLNTKLDQLTELNKSKLQKALYGPVEDLLKLGTYETWSKIRTHLHTETEVVVSEFRSALSGFEFHEQREEILISNLKDHAIVIIESKAREEAAKVLTYMKDRFLKTFNEDNDKKIRLWTNGEDIPAITTIAHSSCLELLSVLTAIRLDEDTDSISEMLNLALGGPNSTKKKLDTDTISEMINLALGGTNSTKKKLETDTWEKVPATKTLITPAKCKSVWNQFQKDTKYTITQANASQKAHNRNEELFKMLNERNERERINEQKRNEKEDRERIERERINEQSLKDLTERMEKEHNEAMLREQERNEREKREQNTRNEQEERKRKERERIQQEQKQELKELKERIEKERIEKERIEKERQEREQQQKRVDELLRERNARAPGFWSIIGTMIPGVRLVMRLFGYGDDEYD